MTDLSHDDLRDLLGAFALDAVDDAEREAVENHLGTCDECRTEADQHRAVAAMLAQADTPLPGGLWDRVQAGISEDDSKPPGSVPNNSAVTRDRSLLRGSEGVVPHDEVLHRGSEGVVPLHDEVLLRGSEGVVPLHDEVVELDSRRRLVPLLSAVAVTVLVALVSVQTVRLDRAQSDLEVSRAQLAAVEQAFVDGDYDRLATLAAATPGAVTVALSGDAGDGSATLLPDGTGFVSTSDLVPLGDSMTYQLWAVVDGEVISAGILGAAPSVTPFRIDPDRLEGLVLTQETAGGVAVSAQPAAAAWFPET